MGLIWYIDPELRRTLLEEIAVQRSERSKYRAIADDECNPYGVQRKAAMRADGCNRAIRALRDVWMASAYAERERTENRLAAEMSERQVLYRIGDVRDWAPGELVQTFGK
jgi:hypothetical protein